MKNRPLVEKANQYQDVYGSQKASTRTTITVTLLILMTIFVIISIIKGNYITLTIFGFWLAFLIVSLFVGRRADRYNAPVKPGDHPDAIFKDHEE